MKATALLILLVAFVCTSEALKCYNDKNEVETCPPGNDAFCILLDIPGGEKSKRCGEPRVCEMEGDFDHHASEKGKFKCCDKDLCNVL